MKQDYSIVITTYNGSKYLIELLDSIRNQTVRPMEVIILDDCSSDNTHRIVTDYIKQYSLEHWKFIVNEHNKGWKENFFQGFSLANGTFIFPCDQDDIWESNKCETMLKVMTDHPDISVLASGYSIFYSEEDHARNSYGKGISSDGKLVPVTVNEKWCHVTRPGCTFCFRKEFFDRIKASWKTEFAHDAILWRNACIEHSLYIINLPLIRFRRHGDNATSVIKADRKNRIEAVDEYLWFHCNLKDKAQSSDAKVIEKGIQWLEKRKKMLVHRNVFLWPAMFIQYRRYYMSLRGCIGDLLLTLKDEL